MLLNLEDEINLEKIEDFKKPDTDPIKKKTRSISATPRKRTASLSTLTGTGR